MPNTQPLVSVLIPCYNSALYIAETLNSVIAQSYTNWECIVVDDHSIDNSVEIIEEYIQTYPGKIKLFTNSRKGACAARNFAFAKSKGEFIQYLDADDLLNETKIEYQLNAVKNDFTKIANGRWGRFYTQTPKKETIEWGPHKSLRKDLSPLEWLQQNHMSQTSCWLIPKHLIEHAGGWDETLLMNQDGEFFSRVITNAKEVIYTPEAKAYYRSQISNSISTFKNSEKFKSLFTTCKKFEQLMLQMDGSPATHLAIANKYQEFVYSAFPLLPELIKTSKQKIKEHGGSNWPAPKGNLIDRLLKKIFGWEKVEFLKSKILNR
jgi:glycosyltransferase involved in cell wall biosynthesis